MSRGRASSDSEDEEMEYPSSPSSKRIKLTNGTNGTHTNGESSGDHDTQALKIDVDGFVEGSIVKITLTNFVTYDYCEIFPGPQMNMIIGPNGTGKSTIVCAIALGLGGSPALLGRAKNIAEFVKTGEDEATICIELKKVGVRNVIIQRSFTKANNATTWRLNGKASSQREVMIIIRKFNIQVDNLCQFLPQDRVSEFAELTPTQLLERTQTAAGETELYEMQKKLMEWRDKQKELEKTQKSDLDHLKSLNTRNQELERDVLRMKQRQEIMERVALLQAQVPLMKYTEAKARSDQIKGDVIAKKEVVQKVKAEAAPVENLRVQAEKEANQLKLKEHDEAKKVREQLVRVKEISNAIQKCRDDIKVNQTTIFTIKKKIPERERAIEDCKVKIQRLEDQTREEPSGDTSHIEEELRRVHEENNDIHSKQDEINQRTRDTTIKKKSLEDSARRKHTGIQEMTNTIKQRVSMIQRDYPQVAQAYTWIRHNQDKFRGRVYGPLALEINVKDTRYASMIEQALGGGKSSVFRTFLCESQEDYKTFTRHLVDEQHLRLNVAWPDLQSDDVLKTNISLSELKQKYDMDHFIVDLIDCKPLVLRYLCLDSKINMTPVALNCSKEQQLANSSVFRKFFVGSTYYNVKQSPYGRKSNQTSTTVIRKAEIIGDSVDKELIAQKKEELQDIQASIQQADVILKEYQVEYDGYRRRIQELKHQKDDLQSQKRDIQIAVNRYKQQVFKIDNLKAELVELQKKPEEYLAQIRQIEEQLVGFKAKEVDLIKKYVVVMRKYVDCYERRNIYGLQYIHSSAKYDAIRSYAKEQTEQLREAEGFLADSKKQQALANREVSHCMEKCRTAGANLDESLQPRFAEILEAWKEGTIQDSLQSLEDKITEEKGRAEAIRFANPDAMKHYEERKTEIARLGERIERVKSNIEACKQEIATIRGVWEPRVDDLVSRISEKFSEAFARIKCHGEVHVDKQEDFDKWGINIMVKFRDTEKLQQLTGTRQSGGERSVSTVLYLMSLQNLAKSPFRVVDEINQGMDPRNERMIHEQIVQGASRPGTSQYFLITPKLLPDLFYNERMCVLCIYNSEWLPAKIAPLSQYLEHAQTNLVA